MCPKLGPLALSEATLPSFRVCTSNVGAAGPSHEPALRYLLIDLKGIWVHHHQLRAPR